MMWGMLVLETIQIGLIVWLLLRMPVATNDYILKPVVPSLFRREKKKPKVHDDESAYRKEIEDQKGH